MWGGGRLVIVESLAEDGHINSFHSVFPGAQLDAGGDTVSATEPPIVPFLLIPIGGCPQDP